MFNVHVANLLHTIGQQSASEDPPTAPTLVLADNGDGTGFTATLSGYDVGTSNTLYVGIAGGSFASEGSVWDVSHQIDVSADNGRWFAFVISTIRGKNSVSDMDSVTVTSGPGAATDNIPFVRRAMRQTAVYWPPETEFDEYGDPEPQDPVEISCRWEEELKEFVDLDGTTKLSRAQVYVDRDVKRGGILMKGELEDITDYDNPKENTRAEEILAFETMPNIRNTGQLRIAFL